MVSLRKLTMRHWVWVHFKLALLAWAIAILLFTPKTITAALGWVSVLVSAVTIIGALISMVGLVMSAQGPSTRIGVAGITVELAGLCFVAAGPVGYLITQIYLASTTPSGDQRIALCFFAYAMCAALVCRIMIVVPRRIKEAHDPHKDV